VVSALHVEDHAWISQQRPGAQAGNSGFVRVARRSRGGMSTDVRVCLLEFIDKAEHCLLAPSFRWYPMDGIIDVPVRQYARDDRSGLQTRQLRRRRLRSESKYAASAGAAEAVFAPSRSKSCRARRPRNASYSTRSADEVRPRDALHLAIPLEFCALRCRVGPPPVHIARRFVNVFARADHCGPQETR